MPTSIVAFAKTHGPVNNEDPVYQADADTITSTQVGKSGVTLEAQGVNAGDRIEMQGREVLITAVSGGTMTVSGFDPAGDRRFIVRRHAGAPGTNLTMRQLQSVRGLATLKDTGGAEHVAIADPVGARVALWDARTIQDVVRGGGPLSDGRGVAPHGDQPPLRARSRNNVIRLLQYASGALTQVASYPLGVTLGRTDGNEVGLAAIAAGTDVMLAVTDAATARVLEYKLSSAGVLSANATYTQALPPVVSTAALSRPLDVAYSLVGGVRRLYVTDAQNRVLRVF